MEYLTSIKSTAMNKARARVWLESNKLADYGFARHTPIKIELITSAGYIRVTADPNGDRKVAGRERNGKAIQILDICMPVETREQLREGADKFRVYIKYGEITIVGGLE